MPRWAGGGKMPWLAADPRRLKRALDVARNSSLSKQGSAASAAQLTARNGPWGGGARQWRGVRLRGELLGPSRSGRGFRDRRPRRAAGALQGLWNTRFMPGFAGVPHAVENSNGRGSPASARPAVGPRRS